MVSIKTRTLHIFTLYIKQNHSTFIKNYGDIFVKFFFLLYEITHFSSCNIHLFRFCHEGRFFEIEDFLFVIKGKFYCSKALTFVFFIKIFVFSILTLSINFFRLLSMRSFSVIFFSNQKLLFFKFSKIHNFGRTLNQKT